MMITLTPLIGYDDNKHLEVTIRASWLVACRGAGGSGWDVQAKIVGEADKV